MDGFTLGNDTLTPPITSFLSSNTGNFDLPAHLTQPTPPKTAKPLQLKSSLPVEISKNIRTCPPINESGHDSDDTENDSDSIDTESDDTENDSDETDNDSDNDSDENETENNTEVNHIYESTHDYYNSLRQLVIDDDVEMMKCASLTELYTLISTNCLHYVSLIEHYKKENLQTLFNFIIRRVEGHLLIKYKLNANERWVEFGFFDDDNTEMETLRELKPNLVFYLKHSTEDNQNRRQHIAGQFDDDDNQKVSNSTPNPKPISTNLNQIPDDHFDPKKNPELQPNQQQLISAGYRPVPESLKGLNQQLKHGSKQVFKLDDFEQQLEQTKPNINQNITVIPDDHFDPKNNPELQPSLEQLQSAGYPSESISNRLSQPFASQSVVKPTLAETAQMDHAFVAAKQRYGPQSIPTMPSGGYYNNQMLPSNEPISVGKWSEIPTTIMQIPKIDSALAEFKNKLSTQLKAQMSTNIKPISPSLNLDTYIHLVPQTARHAYSQLIEKLSQQSKTTELLNILQTQLAQQPQSQHPHIYHFIDTLLQDYSPSEILAITSPKIVQTKSLSDCLTEQQRQIVNQYNIDLNQLI